MAELLDDNAIAAGLQGLDWTRDGSAIKATVVRKNFVEAMQFVNQVAELAESRNHHPDIAISWNKVTLTLSTHDAGGLTQLDLDLAAAIDGLAKPA
jgi:4a-hydroxytetrahydrobiopterin dehydratase